MTAFSRWSRVLVVAGLATLAVTVPTAVASVAAADRSSVAQPTDAHLMSMAPLFVRPAGRAIDGVFSCQTNPLGVADGRCYTPQQIQRAYDVAPLLSAGKDGTGRTIVIVAAYQDPYIQFELNAFDGQFGLPAPSFTQIAPLGLTPWDPTDRNQLGWATEIALDVQYSHAIAPGAKIVLALAPTNRGSALIGTEQYVIQHNVGDVISMSFIETEGCLSPALFRMEHAQFDQATRNKITLVAGSGDSGAAAFRCSDGHAIEAVSTPNSDPNVTSVGGTNLNATITGDYVGETAWSDQFRCNPPSGAAGDGCSGGGFSELFYRPAYQLLIPNPHLGRGVPDVALNAGIDGGVLMSCGACSVQYGLPSDANVFWRLGGTSAGGPQWAGLVAIADQMAGRRLGLINPALYAIGASPQQYHQAFHDITHGNNRVAVLGGAGYDTKANWDPVTGLGTPNAAKLLPLVVAWTH